MGTTNASLHPHNMRYCSRRILQATCSRLWQSAIIKMLASQHLPNKRLSTLCRRGITVRQKSFQSTFFDQSLAGSRTVLFQWDGNRSSKSFCSFRRSSSPIRQFCLRDHCTARAKRKEHKEQHRGECVSHYLLKSQKY